MITPNLDGFCEPMPAEYGPQEFECDHCGETVHFLDAERAADAGWKADFFQALCPGCALGEIEKEEEGGDHALS